MKKILLTKIDKFVSILPLNMKNTKEKTKIFSLMKTFSHIERIDYFKHLSLKERKQINRYLNQMGCFVFLDNFKN